MRYPEKVECRQTEFRMLNIRRRWKVGRIEFLPGWNELCCASLSGATPSGFPKRARDALPYPEQLHPEEAHGTREHHTLDDSISYPDMLSGSLTKVSKPCYVIPTACHNPCSATLRWCVRTPCSDIFCHEFQRTLLNLGLLW